jgi:hypothetical protein
MNVYQWVFNSSLTYYDFGGVSHEVKGPVGESPQADLSREQPWLEHSRMGPEIKTALRGSYSSSWLEAFSQRRLIP